MLKEQGVADLVLYALALLVYKKKNTDAKGAAAGGRGRARRRLVGPSYLYYTPL